ncbi:MAG: cystathionine gamma-synthase family protein [Gemmatimonadales bacterium]|nr:cystathionine gamma-synthase family protein [Gemmatimonadales bacterium]
MPKHASHRAIGSHALRPESLMMGYGYDPRLSEGAVKCPIFQTSTFVFESAEAGKAFFEVAYGLREASPGEVPGLIYSRLNNPDLEILEDRLCLWDDAESCAVFSSGMAATTTALMAYLRPGDAVIYSAPIYGGSDHFLHHVLPTWGVTAFAIPAGERPEAYEAELRTRMAGRPLGAVLLETPANPTNGLVDIAAMAAMTRRLETPGRRAPVMVDNTFLGPLWQQPLQHGADVVLYSATKFIGGHSDVIAGAALGSKEMMAPIRGLRTFLGSMLSPMDGWLLMRSLETLKMRMTASMKNARYVAAFLKTHPKVAALHYLGELAADHPMRDVYERQCSGPGSLIAFEVPGGEVAAFRVLNAMQLVKLAVSLGGTESLAEHPASMTHADVSREDQARYGITPGLIRLSVGVEHYDDLIADLAQALDHA